MQMYRREAVTPEALGEFMPVSSFAVDQLPEALTKAKTEPAEGENDGRPATINAFTYVWSNPLSQLASLPWSNEEFMRDKLSLWV